MCARARTCTGSVRAHAAFIGRARDILSLLFPPEWDIHILSLFSSSISELDGVSYANASVVGKRLIFFRVNHACLGKTMIRPKILGAAAAACWRWMRRSATPRSGTGRSMPGNSRRWLVPATRSLPRWRFRPCAAAFHGLVTVSCVPENAGRGVPACRAHISCARGHYSRAD